MKRRQGSLKRAVVGGLAAVLLTLAIFPVPEVAAQNHSLETLSNAGQVVTIQVEAHTAIDQDQVLAEADVWVTERESFAQVAVPTVRQSPLLPRQMRRLKRADLDVEHMLAARDIIKSHSTSPFGTQIDVNIGGEQFVAVIERHFHPEGGPIKPWGYHPGVSLFALR